MANGDSKSDAPKGTQSHKIRRALAFAAPFRQAVYIIIAITLVLAAINAAEPLILKYIFDNLIPHGPNRLLLKAFVLLIAVGIFREIATAFSNWLTWRTRLHIHYSLLENTVERLHRMPLSFHRTEGVGAIMTKLDRSIQGFITGIGQILFNVFPAILYLCISIIVMLRLNWKLAVIVMCFLPVPAISRLSPARNKPAGNAVSWTNGRKFTRVSTRFSRALSQSEVFPWRIPKRSGS